MTLFLLLLKFVGRKLSLDEVKNIVRVLYKYGSETFKAKGLLAGLPLLSKLSKRVYHFARFCVP